MLDQKIELKMFDSFKKTTLTEIQKLKEYAFASRATNKSPDLSQSFYSQVNQNNNTSDLMDLFTDRKKNYGSVTRLNRSVSKERNTLKTLENRLTIKIDILSDKHQKL